jgi:hypothetical protein
MVSAFHAPSLTRKSFAEDSIELFTGSLSPASIRHDHTAKLSAVDFLTSCETDMSETEDEEVKMNCMGGIQAYMTSSDEEEYEDDCESCGSEESEGGIDERGVVDFVARQVYQAPAILRPRPLLGGIAENDDGSDVSTSSTESIEELDADDQGSAVSDDESSDADNESSDDAEDDDNEIEQDEITNDQTDEPSTDWSRAESIVEGRLGSQSLFDFGCLSQGTPEVCDEDFYEFGDYDSQSLNVIEKVLALESTTSDPISSRPKRLLSSLCLGDDQHTEFDTPKKTRRTSSTLPPCPGISDLFLGPSAYEALGELKYRDTIVSPFSEQEAEHDRALGEELIEAAGGLVNDRESTPVPLLSPPPSPLCVESDKGQLTTVCEWPSNLAVDCALLVTSLRSHSPAYLVRFDEDRFVSCFQGFESGTSLTPLLQGIRVNLE